MFYLHNLRVRLQERRKRLYRTDSITYDAELRYFLQFLDENTYIRSLLATLDANTSVDFEQWTAELSDMWDMKFPQKEEGRAKVCYGILRRCVDDKHDDNALGWAQRFSSETKYYDDMLRDLTEAISGPICQLSSTTGLTMEETSFF